MINEFYVNITEPVLDDLRARLSKTIWPEQFDDKGWKTGTDKTYLETVCEYWKSEFDWRKQENYLNTFHHFKAAVDGRSLHFIHHKGEGETRIPLLLIHGYPDSFVRFLKIIPLLTAADEHGFSFDVVVPSLPGYGFSDYPENAGMDTRKIADLLATLMTTELGYERFIVHGGDWGGGVTEQIGLYHSDNVIGLHLTDVPFQHGLTPPDNLSQSETKYFERIQKWRQTEGAYSLIQATKPQSLSYGLTDSPVGLAGWILEKFYAWSDNDGDLDNVFSRDILLTNLTIYWTTQTIHSAMRLYYEAITSFMSAKYNPLVKLNPFDKTGQKPNVPAGFALFPKDISVPPKDYAERFFNVIRWNEMPAGGHFAALEQPQLLAKEIRAFAGEVFR